MSATAFGSYSAKTVAKEQGMLYLEGTIDPDTLDIGLAPMWKQPGDVLF